jgi:hypothetical protein
MKMKSRGIGEVLFPVMQKGGVLNTVETHLGQGDAILLAALDVAEVGRREAEEAGDGPNNERFIVIQELLALYRAGNSALIEKLYQAKAHVAA